MPSACIIRPESATQVTSTSLCGTATSTPRSDLLADSAILAGTQTHPESGAACWQARLRNGHTPQIRRIVITRAVHQRQSGNDSEMQSPQQPLHGTANVAARSRPSGWARNPRRNRPATAPTIGCGDAAARSGLNSTHPSVSQFRQSLPFRRIRTDCAVAHRNYPWLAFAHSALYVPCEHEPRFGDLSAGIEVKPHTGATGAAPSWRSGGLRSPNREFWTCSKQPSSHRRQTHAYITSTDRDVPEWPGSPRQQFRREREVLLTSGCEVGR